MYKGLCYLVNICDASDTVYVHNLQLSQLNDAEQIYILCSVLVFHL